MHKRSKSLQKNRIIEKTAKMIRILAVFVIKLVEKY